MKLVQFDFAFSRPFGDAMASALKDLAESIAREPGLVWKIWTENQAAGEAGGIYLFSPTMGQPKLTLRNTRRDCEASGSRMRG